MILGDFDFMEIYTAKPNWGPFYFISYIFMVFFFLLNMFLAIVNDTYAEVKEEMDEEPFDVGAYFKEGQLQKYFQRFESDGCHQTPKNVYFDVDFPFLEFKRM